MKNNTTVNNKGFVQVALVAGIVIALGVIGYILYFQKTNSSLMNSNLYNPQAVPSAFQDQYQASGQEVTAIKNANDLDSASASLDATGTTEIDTQLNALNSASSGF